MICSLGVQIGPEPATRICATLLLPKQQSPLSALFIPSMNQKPW